MRVQDLFNIFILARLAWSDREGNASRAKSYKSKYPHPRALIPLLPENPNNTTQQQSITTRESLLKYFP